MFFVTEDERVFEKIKHIETRTKISLGETYYLLIIDGFELQFLHKNEREEALQEILKNSEGIIEYGNE